MYKPAVSSVGQEIEVACLCFSSKCPLLVELERVKNEMIYLGQTAQEAEERETPPREWGGGLCFLVGQFQARFRATSPERVYLQSVPLPALWGQGQLEGSGP